jgi:hypothetical protein
MIITLGAPAGAFNGRGKSGVDSLTPSAILPLNAGSGFGIWLDSCFSAESFSDAL